MNLFHERGTEHPTSPWNRINWHAVTEMVRRIRYNACKPGMNDHILDQTMNGSGVRDIERSSQVSTGIVLSTITAIKDGLVQVNQALLERMLTEASGCEVEMFCINRSEFGRTVTASTGISGNYVRLTSSCRVGQIGGVWI
ncbi:MAG: hypothetical protein GY801_01745 [bacterium]|nr:hypothetical protein [bacterium]